MDDGLQDPPHGHYFLSYSRSETPLVLDLAAELENRFGVETWLDFRDLRPGEPWDRQLERAIDDAAGVIVIVSDRAVSGSAHVAAEWTQALQRGKRVVLATAGQADLPDELKNKPRIDLRPDWDTQIDRLGALLLGADSPQAVEPLDATDDVVPPIVRRAYRLAQVVAVISLISFWTVAVPLILLPLPARILKRDFDYLTVRTALLALPFTTLAWPWGDGAGNGRVAMFLIPAFFSIWLFKIMRSSEFRRWMSPRAARPVRKEIEPVDRKPSRVRYGIDSVPEDEPHVTEVIRAFEPIHRQPVSCSDRPDVMLRFVSNFNDRREIGSDTATIPILVSDPDDELPRGLSRVQWIDLRHGGRLRRTSEIDAMANLIDQPAELLKRIGVPPPHGQRMLPSGIQVLTVVLWACLLAATGGSLARIATPSSDPDWLPSTLVALLLAAVVVAMIAFMLPRLRYRIPTPLRRLYTPALAVMMYLLHIVPNYSEVEESDQLGTVGAAVGSIMALLALVALVVGWMLSARDLKRWLPSRRYSSDSGDGELTAAEQSVSMFRRFRVIVREARNDVLGRPSSSA